MTSFGEHTRITWETSVWEPLYDAMGFPHQSENGNIAKAKGIFVKKQLQKNAKGLPIFLIAWKKRTKDIACNSNLFSSPKYYHIKREWLGILCF